MPFLAALLAALLWAAPAHAAPIAAAIVGATGLFTAGTAAYAIAVALTTFVLESGAAWALSKLTSKGVKDKATAQQRQASILSLSIGEHPREVVFGRAATGGSLLDGFNFGGTYGTDWEVLVIALADHPIDALEGFILDGTFYAYSTNGGQAAFSNGLDLEFVNATAAGTAPPSRFASVSGGRWTSDDVLAGVTRIWVAYNADPAIWPKGRPTGFKFVLRGKKLYDPRKDSTVAGGSGAHRWSDPSTWEWGENAILCDYNFDRGIYAGDRVDDPQHLWVGRGLSEVEAPPADIFAAANLCDEAVYVLGSDDPVARYRCGGVIGADETFDKVKEKFAAACAGVIAQRQGAVRILPGAAQAAALEISDADLVVGETVTFDRFLQNPSRVNCVIGSYVEPAQGWENQSAPVRRSLADIADDGGQKPEPLQLDLVTYQAQAQRCAEAERRLGRLERRVTLTLHPGCSGLEEGDWIGWTSDRYHDGARVLYRVESWSLDAKWRWTGALREIEAEVYDWDRDTDEDVPGAAPRPEGVALPTLALDAVDIVLVAGAQTPTVRATWTAPVDPAIAGVLLEAKRTVSGDVSQARSDTPNDGAMISTNIAAGSSIQARVTPIPIDPRRAAAPSDWFPLTTPGVYSPGAQTAQQTANGVQAQVDTISGGAARSGDNAGSVDLTGSGWFDVCDIALSGVTGSALSVLGSACTWGGTPSFSSIVSGEFRIVDLTDSSVQFTGRWQQDWDNDAAQGSTYNFDDTSAPIGGQTSSGSVTYRLQARLTGGSPDVTGAQFYAFVRRS